mgnify:CR=1 FL=1
MLQATFFGYVRIHSVGNTIAMGTSNGRGAPLYKLSATAFVAYGGTYIDGEFVEDNREIDLDFTNLTDKSSRLILPESEILINGGKPFSYVVGIGFPAKIAKGIVDGTTMGNPAVYTAEAVILGIADRIGKEHLDNLRMIIPSERRKTAIEIPSGTWNIKAHPNQIASAQKLEVQIETPV